MVKNNIIENERNWLNSILACPCCLFSNITSQLQKHDNLSYYQCQNCNAIYPIDSYGVINFEPLDQICRLPEPYFGMWALAQHGSVNDYKQRKPASISSPERNVVQAFSNFIDVEGQTVLDVGSGTDYLPGYINNQYIKQYVALDPLPAYQEIPYIKIQGWAEMMPFSDNVFDAIVIGTSLDHFICLRSSLSEINRILKIQGSLFLWGGWFIDDTHFKNLPPYQLFKREKVGKISRQDSLKKYMEDKSSLDAKYNNIDELEKKYSQYLVDKWHFRHIPLSFFKNIKNFGFSLENIELWELGYHYEKIFFSAFLRLRKQNFYPAEKNTTIQQHIDQLTLTAQVIEKINTLEQRILPTLATQVIEKINTLEQRVLSVENQTGSIDQKAEDLRLISQKIVEIKQKLRIGKIKLDLVNDILNIIGKLKKKLRGSIQVK
jgi:ubiquinone/menaquinone biosynthesis C-methylase UbiE